MDIMRHKDAVDDIVKTGKALLNSKSADEKAILMVFFFSFTDSECRPRQAFAHKLK